MKNIKHQSILSLMAILLCLVSANAQSISGNVKAFSSTEDLGYANVDIYQGDKLVASVLADGSGNFDVKLDTGMYTTVINYAGYKKITQEIHVTNDEKADFSLKEDADSRFKKEKLHKDREDKPGSLDGIEPEVEMGEIAMEDELIHFEGSRGSGIVGSSAPSPSYSYTTRKKSIVRGDVRGPVSQGEAGKLTAGEVNDFSKWDLWTDLKNDELKNYQAEWNFSPSQRYMVQVTDQKGLPLADISVYLATKDGERLFAARTDNTGKAELWQGLSYQQSVVSEKLSMEVIFNGKKHIIKKAKPFSKGVNTLELETECNQSQKVDIAFVVDATGSMSDELNFLKAELNDVMFKAKQISSTLNFSFANVFYRDHGDAYLTRTQDFTRILSESVSFISDQRAGGGGDFPEAVDDALDTAINTLSWSKYARARIVFLILDAPPHNTPAIQERLNRVSKQAAAKGIRVVPLVASGINKSTEYLMRSIALATNGTYAFLTDHSGIGGGHLAPSTDSYEVETLNDLLVRVIKSYTYMPDCEQELPDLNLDYPDSLVVITNPMDTTSKDSTANVIDPVKVSWSFYPNPTRGFVNIKANVAIKELYISDLSGKVLQVLKDIQPEEAVRADLRGYASGIYLIRYPVGKQWISGKVVLVRD